MAAVTFDTHAFIKQLKEAGFEEAQAEALSETFKKAQEAHLGELATRHDFEELKLSIRHDIEEFKLATRHDIEELKASTKLDIEELKPSTRHDLKELELRIDGELKLLKWMTGVTLAGVVSLVLKAFFM